jgi:hypothetical protein
MKQNTETKKALKSLVESLHSPELVGSVVELVFPDRVEVFSIGLSPIAVQDVLESASVVNQAYMTTGAGASSTTLH